MIRLLKPPPKTNIAEWAENHRYLARGTSAEAGKFSCDRLPYQREPMESLTDPEAASTVLMWAAQLGKTEILLNTIGYFVDASPAPMLIVQATLDTARKFSQKKLAPMIDESPSLKKCVRDPRTRDSGNTVLSKEFRGGSLVIAGSNSPASLRQLSCQIVVQDEVDTYEASAGAEGDPCLLADARAANFHNAVFLKASTPTIRGASRIENYFDESDQRYWHCPCPHCGEYQTLKWGQVKWPQDELENAYYLCEHCEQEINDTQRVQMIMQGKWVATHPERRARGYHLSGLYRIMGRKRQFNSYLHEFAVQFLEAKHKGRESLKVWTNVFLSETWEEKGERVSLTDAMERCEDYKPDPLPKKVGVLTCAVDVQKDRLEFEVMGWGIAEESWGILTGAIHGDPEKLEVWKDLDDLLHRKWTHPSGSRLGIAATCIDSGYATSSVYRFCKPRQERRVYAVKGSNTRGAPLISKRFLKTGRTTLFLVGGDVAKDSIFARLKNKEAGARYMHFPKGYGYTEEWFRQLTAEEVRTRMKNGFPIRFYKKLRERNEALDMRVYNMAALEILNPNMERIIASLTTETVQPNDDQPALKKTPKQKRRGGFVDGWR